MYGQAIWARVLTGLLGYLLGSFSGAIVTSKLLHGRDIRQYGSGNAGLTNALRTFGAKTAVWVSVIDVAKTVAALLLGQFLVGDLAPILAGGGVLLGHAFPLYHHFKGGKCVLSGAVLLLWMDWRAFLVAITCFLGMALATRIVAAGSLLAVVSAPLALAFFRPGEWANIVFIACVAVFITVLHRSNIQRMLEKRELQVIPKNEEDERR